MNALLGALVKARQSKVMRHRYCQEATRPRFTSKSRREKTVSHAGAPRTCCAPTLSRKDVPDIIVNQSEVYLGFRVLLMTIGSEFMAFRSCCALCASAQNVSLLVTGQRSISCSSTSFWSSRTASMVKKSWSSAASI